jgi:glutamate synthase domain-containing protein 2
MVEEGTAPDFIVVDGAEGGTGAAPLEFADHVGTPLTENLITVHNALVGAGLREHVRIGAGGKIATGSDLVKRLLQGADCGNAARAMMFAVGCVQAQRCHTNTCPVGVTTQEGPPPSEGPGRAGQDRAGAAPPGGDGRRRAGDHGGDGRHRPR